MYFTEWYMISLRGLIDYYTKVTFPLRVLTWEKLTMGPTIIELCHQILNFITH